MSRSRVILAVLSLVSFLSVGDSGFVSTATQASSLPATQVANWNIGDGASARYLILREHRQRAGGGPITVKTGGTVTTAGTTTLTDSAGAFATLTRTAGVRPGDSVVITAGPGAGQTLIVQGVTSATALALTAAPSGSVVLAPAARVASRTATGGSTTTLVDTNTDFVAAGVVAGDIITTTAGSGTGQTLTVTLVATNTLTFAAATALSVTTVYHVDGTASTYNVVRNDDITGYDVQRIQ